MNTRESHNIIKETIDIINDMFNQDNMPELYKVYIINECVVVFWSCGAIIAKHQWFQTAVEDDGRWSLSGNFGIFMSSSWIEDFTRGLTILNNYIRDNGKPYHYFGTDIICGYAI